MRFDIPAFEPSTPSDGALAPTGTLVVDGAVHHEGFDGAAAELSGFSASAHDRGRHPRV